MYADIHLGFVSQCTMVDISLRLTYRIMMVGTILRASDRVSADSVATWWSNAYEGQLLLQIQDMRHDALDPVSRCSG